GRQVADTHLALWDRDFDLVLVERIPQPEKYLALDVGHSVSRVVDPEAQKHIDGVVAEPRDMTDRPRRGEHTIGPCCDLDGKSAHRVQITAVGHAERRIEPDQRAGVGPVDHLVGDQVFVRDQVFLAVSTAYRGIAGTEIGDGAEGAADLDHVPGLYRAFEQQDDAADKVRYDFLQAETDADTDGAAKDGECGEVDADGVEADQQRYRDQCDPDKVGGQHLHRGAERGDALEPGADDPREAVRDPQQDCDNECPLQHQKHRQPQRADRDCQVVECRLRRRQEAQDVQREDDPGDGRNRSREQDIAQQQR